jgi:hypothetical protein
MEHVAEERHITESSNGMATEGRAAKWLTQQTPKENDRMFVEDCTNILILPSRLTVGQQPLELFILVRIQAR